MLSAETERDSNEYFDTDHTATNRCHSAHRPLMRWSLNAQSRQLARPYWDLATIPSPIVSRLLHLHRVDADRIRVADLLVRARHGSGRTDSPRFVHYDGCLLV